MESARIGETGSHAVFLCPEVQKPDDDNLGCFDTERATAPSQTLSNRRIDTTLNLRLAGGTREGVKWYAWLN